MHALYTLLAIILIALICDFVNISHAIEENENQIAINMN